MSDETAKSAGGQWRLRPGVTYLNHGSYGPPPQPVIAARTRWQAEIDADPMDFFLRRLEPELTNVRERLARFVGCSSDDLVLVENATYGMNVVARSFAMAAGDEVLLTDHEYGAVERIWRRKCRETGAQIKIVALPQPLGDADEVVASIAAAVTPRTRLAIVSHITSPTGIVLPVAAIVAKLKGLGVATCIDGPHALATLPLALAELGCDYYLASGHKWLCAPLGTGLLYVARQRQSSVEPIAMSWGHRGPDSGTWRDEFTWPGTRDFTPWLSISAAIEFMEGVGLERFREHGHALAQRARQKIVSLTGLEPLVPDDPAWYGPMLSLPLPDGDDAALHRALWERHQIEAATMIWQGRRFVRPCCHLYNTEADVDRLAAALGPELAG